jgi:2-haloacid dehalogenase
MDRREFMLGAAGLTSAARYARPAPNRMPSAVVFDGFPIIDARPVAARAEEIFPGYGAKLMDTWRTRQFEYTWLRTVARKYSDFWNVSQDALVFAARSLGLDLNSILRTRLMGAYLELSAWSDVRSALEQLRSAGIRIAFLSDFTARMLDAALENSKLAHFFEPHLSTDRVRAFKPDARAYAMALDAFSTTRDDIVFCAGAGWDAAGAKYFGYRTFWLNRQELPAEELGAAPDAVGGGMAELLSFLSIG